MDLDEILEYPNDIASCYKKCKRNCPWREFEENKWYFLTKIIVEDIYGPNYFLFNDFRRKSTSSHILFTI